ncbi:hypothetical protein [Bhargavaea ginsengi]|uniref:hypothetical protein n=1 Tax=Bhargavaea ginsengi TaxID=426757 RepID=UPI003C73B55B
MTSKREKIADINPNVVKRYNERNVGRYDGKYYDLDTGECLPDNYKLTVEPTPEQKRRLTAYNDLAKHEIENGGFIFAFFTRNKTALAELFPELTETERARVVLMARFIAYETGRLQHDNGNIIRKKNLVKILNMSDKRFGEFFRKITSLEIITENTETGELFMNQSVFYRGDLKAYPYKLDKDTRHARVFRQTYQDLYEKFQGRQLSKLHLIYDILPYLNLKTNILCHNPEESDTDLLRLMSVDELAEKLGYADHRKLKRAMNDVKVSGEPVFNFMENPYNRRQKRCRVNPRVIYAGGADALKLISAEFNA